MSTKRLKYTHLLMIILCMLICSAPISAHGHGIAEPEPLTFSGAEAIADTIGNRPDGIEAPVRKDSVAYTIPGSRPTPAKYDPHTDPNRDWLHLALKGYFNPKDTTVRYSKFMKLFNAVYNWGDRVFNSYDSTYVAGFGKNWKARLAFEAWTDSYNMRVDNTSMLFLSEPYTTLGAYLHFMAVSVGYKIDLGKTFRSKPVRHTKFEFGFNCARFYAEFDYNSNTGGTYIRRFGNYKNKKFVREFFPGVKNSVLNFSIYYFFNNRKYANGAAYNFSRLQKKSAGSFLLGFNHCYQHTEINFATLPEDMLPYLTFNTTRYNFRYHEFCLMLGYGYNWVLNKHLLFNATLQPSIGVTRGYEDSYDGTKLMLALNGNGRVSLTYNLKDFFTCLILKSNIQWYNSDRLSLFTGIHNFQLSVGYRF